MSTEAMKLALAVLEFDSHYGTGKQEAITALREALAEQPAQQEPVGEAYLCDKCHTPFDGCWYCPECNHNTATKELVYISPPTLSLAQRPWIGLTDEGIYSVLENLQVMYNRPPTTDSRVIFARAIEAKLKEKNHV